MTHPVMNRVSDTSALNTLTALQPVADSPDTGPGFSRVFEQSVRNQQDNPPPAREREAPRAERPEPPGRQQQTERSEMRPQSAPSDRADPDRSSEPAKSRPAETGRAASASASKDGSDVPPSDSGPLPIPGPDTAALTEGDAAVGIPANVPALTAIIAALASGANAQGSQTVTTTGPNDAIDPATAAGVPANLAALTAIIAALARGANAQGLQTDATTGADDAGNAGVAGGRPGATLATLLKSDAATDGAPDGANEGPAKAAIVQQWKDGLLAANGAPGRNVAQIATTLTAQAGVQSNLAGAPAAALQAVTAEGSPGHGGAHNGVIPALRGEPAALPQLQIHTPAGQRAWAEDIGSRMVWLIGRGESRAELVLTPPSLGKLGISIQVSGEQTTAHFVTSTAAARDALEQALPRLRELMQQAGINLGQTDVSTSSDRQASGDEGMSSARRAFGLGRNAAGQVDIELPMAGIGDNWPRAGAGVIDTFA